MRITGVLRLRSSANGRMLRRPPAAAGPEGPCPDGGGVERARGRPRRRAVRRSHWPRGMRRGWGEGVEGAAETARSPAFALATRQGAEGAADATASALGRRGGGQGGGRWIGEGEGEEGGGPAAGARSAWAEHGHRTCPRPISAMQRKGKARGRRLRLGRRGRGRRSSPNMPGSAPRNPRLADSGPDDGGGGGGGRRGTVW